MTNGWTGGQYSLYRALFGLYLFVHFTTLLPWGPELFSNSGVLPSGASPLLRFFPNVLVFSDTPLVVSMLISVGAIASIGFTLGLYDRAAAVLLWYILTCLFGRNSLISNPSLPFIGWLLLMHALLPQSPYGSWSARARLDPRGGWRMPPALFAAAWVLVSAGYAYSAYTKIVSPSWIDGTALSRVLNNPLARPTFVRDLLLAMPPGALQLATWGALGLELLYAPLALFRRARPWMWTAMVVMHLTLIILIDFAELSVGMLIVHLFTFDPRWVPARWSERRDQLFYDGTCGLCHRAIRFVLSEDRRGTAFTFAPLHGDTYAAAIAGHRHTALPDSMVVRTEEGEMLIRSDAVLYVLRRLGGLWRVIAAGLCLVPGGLRNAAYDFVAKIRHRVFAREVTTCPLLPADLRSRFQG